VKNKNAALNAAKELVSRLIRHFSGEIFYTDS